MATITREILESYVHCRYKSHLKLIGERGIASDYETNHFKRRAGRHHSGRPRQERAVAVCGRPRIYADAAFECALVVKTVFQLSLRATQGVLESVVELMGVAPPVPDYSTVCRRQNGTRPGLALAPSAPPRHVVIDTTGGGTCGGHRAERLARAWRRTRDRDSRRCSESSSRLGDAPARTGRSIGQVHVLNRMVSLGMPVSERIPVT